MLNFIHIYVLHLNWQNLPNVWNVLLKAFEKKDDVLWSTIENKLETVLGSDMYAHISLQIKPTHISANAGLFNEFHDAYLLLRCSCYPQLVGLPSVVTYGISTLYLYSRFSIEHLLKLTQLCVKSRVSKVFCLLCNRAGKANPHSRVAGS